MKTGTAGGRQDRHPTGFPEIGGAANAFASRSFRNRLTLLLIAALNRFLPKNDGKVVLHSATDLEDGILAVLEALLKRGWKPTVLLEDPAKGPVLRALISGTVATVPKHSWRGLYEFLTAKYVVMTHGLFGDQTPPRKQVVVNLWHGEPPTKVVGRFEGARGRETTYAPVLSTVGRAYRSAEFGISPLQVPIIGAPRNDRLIGADAVPARQRLLGDATHQTVFFWLPTFRAMAHRAWARTDVTAQHPTVPFGESGMRQMDDWLAARGVLLVVKPHPHDLASFSGDYRAIRILRQHEMERLQLTLYPLLSISECLLTDFSSVWIDYLLIDKPLIFGIPDVDDYRSARGFNLEPYEAWVPGPCVKSIDELLEAMAEIVDGHDPMAEERQRARVRFHHFLDGRSTERLLDGLGIDARPGA